MNFSWPWKGNFTATSVSPQSPQFQTMIQENSQPLVVQQLQGRVRSLEQSVQAAADSSLDKGTKLGLATQAVFLQQFQQLAQSEIKDAKYLKAKRLGGAWEEDLKNSTPGVDEVGDIIICDDYNLNKPPATQPAPVTSAPATVTPTWAKVLAGTALALGLGGAGAAATYFLTRPSSPATSPAAPSTSTNTTKGFQIDLVPSPDKP